MNAFLFAIINKSIRLRLNLLDLLENISWKYRYIERGSPGKEVVDSPMSKNEETSNVIMLSSYPGLKRIVSSRDTIGFKPRN